MLVSVRLWITTGALFLALLPSLPVDLARLEAGGESCSNRGGSCCRLMSALKSHYQGGDQLERTADSCPKQSCSMSSLPNSDGTPAERSVGREAVAAKAAPGYDQLTVPARTACDLSRAAGDHLPSSPFLEIRVPPPRPLHSA